MNETPKTITFVVVAAVVALAAWLASPSPQTSERENVHNQPLYPDFKDPTKVASLDITKYDEAHGTFEQFKVAQEPLRSGEGKGKLRWSIPSHGNYPVDAKDQMAAAGAAMVGLKIIDKVSDNEGDQQTYGVVDPDPKVLTLGATGVGDRIVMNDKDKNPLLAIVIGKPVPDRPNSDLRYVRKVGDSEIYTVEIKSDKLSVKFADWIEPDLLRINTLDLKQIWIDDYAIRSNTLRPRGKMEIGYSDSEPHWKMLRDEVFMKPAKSPARGRWRPVAIGANEEINTARLDELKNALYDLKIVDVNRKPEGLSKDLKVEANFPLTDEVRYSLRERGFYLVPSEDNTTVDLFSNEGETRLSMAGGVQYVLRFGQIADSTSTGKDKKSKEKERDGKKEAEKDKKATGLNRYLFVMAEFDQTAIPKPQLEPLPEPAKAKEPAKQPEAKPADAKKPDAAKPAEKKPGDKKAEAAKPDAKNAEAEKKAFEAERARIEKENKRKQEEYDRQVADGKKKVAELNARFADWYYIISDEVYRKIHLSREDVVVKKPKKDDKAGEAKGGAHKAAKTPPFDIMVPPPAHNAPGKPEAKNSGAK
jgi:hypothetical protein